MEILTFDMSSCRNMTLTQGQYSPSESFHHMILKIQGKGLYIIFISIWSKLTITVLSSAKSNITYGWNAIHRLITMMTNELKDYLFVTETNFPGWQPFPNSAVFIFLCHTSHQHTAIMTSEFSLPVNHFNGFCATEWSGMNNRWLHTMRRNFFQQWPN